MDQVHVIHHKVLVEEQSIRSVAKEMGLSRNTVSKYLTVPEPERIARRPKPSPVMETVAPRIEELPDEWRGSRSSASPGPGSTESSSRRATSSASPP